MTTKNRLLAAALSGLTLFTALVLFPPQRSRAETDNVLRLHILANSDSEADQAVKLVVRDAILQIMEPTSSAAEAEEYVLKNGARLLAAAEDALRENGFCYGAQLMLGVSQFPDRRYDGELFPAGEYLALKVLLGAGAGHNWWCVLFPPLCIVTREQEPLPEKDDIHFESTLVNWWRARRAAS